MKQYKAEKKQGLLGVSNNEDFHHHHHDEEKGFKTDRPMSAVSRNDSGISRLNLKRAE